MSTKINQLLQQWPHRGVGTCAYLSSKGVDYRLAEKYVRSGWLERIGYGAYKRTGATVDWPGAVQALQSQLHLDVHPGGITAAELRGYMQYLSFGKRPVTLFGKPGTKLPAWFLDNQWPRPVRLVTTNAFVSDHKTISPVLFEEVELDVATLELAALEMMYLVPRRQSYEEAFQIMEMMSALRPAVVQRLLENCTSIKVKRLFMHVAEEVNHTWLKYLDPSKIDFGSGRRAIHAGGRLDRKYNLVVDDPLQL